MRGAWASGAVLYDTGQGGLSLSSVRLFLGRWGDLGGMGRGQATASSGALGHLQQVPFYLPLGSRCRWVECWAWVVLWLW